MSKSSEEGGAAGSTSPQDTGAGNGAQKDANGNIYEDRGRTKKIIRVVTVMAYVFSVSFVAILLSAYYVFLWEPPNPRLQRHPLTGDPQAEFLIDDLSPSSNTMNPSENRSAEFVDDPNARINIFRKIMTSDRETRDFSLKLATLPQKLFTYEDIVEFNRRAATEPEDSTVDPIAPRSTVADEATKAAVTSDGASTTLPIFLKTYSVKEIPATSSSVVKMPKILTRSKKVYTSLGGSTWSLVDKKKDIEVSESSRIPAEVIERGNESIDSSTPGKILGEETVSTTPGESSTSDVMSTGDPGATVYPGIGNYSYPEAIGSMAENNKVTVGAEVIAMTGTTTPQTISALENDPEDDKFDVSLRKHESRLSEDLENEELTTAHSEVQIYPEEILRDITNSEK